MEKKIYFDCLLSIIYNLIIVDPNLCLKHWLNNKVDLYFIFTNINPQLILQSFKH